MDLIKTPAPNWIIDVPLTLAAKTGEIPVYACVTNVVQYLPDRNKLDPNTKIEMCNNSFNN